MLNSIVIILTEKIYIYNFSFLHHSFHFKQTESQQKQAFLHLCIKSGRPGLPCSTAALHYNSVLSQIFQIILSHCATLFEICNS